MKNCQQNPTHNDSKNGSTRERKNARKRETHRKCSDLIAELRQELMVPSSIKMKVDQNTVLKLAVTFLRQMKLKTKLPNFPLQLGESFTLALEDDEIGVILTSDGEIIDITGNVEKNLHHPKIQLLSEQFLSIVHTSDHAILNNCLKIDKDFSTIDDTSSVIKQKRECLLSIFSKKHNSYKKYQLSGYLQVPRKKFHGEVTSEGEVTHLVAVMRPVKEPLTKLSMYVMRLDQYITQHSLDGRIINADERIFCISQFTIREVYNQIAFDFMHPDDKAYVQVALREMVDSGRNYGTSFYRLRSKNGTYIFLRTEGFFEMETQNSNESVCLICVNTVLTKEEGEHSLIEMRQKYGTAITMYDGIQTNRQLIPLIPTTEAQETETYSSSLHISLDQNYITPLIPTNENSEIDIGIHNGMNDFDSNFPLTSGDGIPNSPLSPRIQEAVTFLSNVPAIQKAVNILLNNPASDDV